MYKYKNMIYKGKKLCQYCRDNNIKYSLIGRKIYYGKKMGYFKDLPNEERINLYFEKYYVEEKKRVIKKNINLLKENNLSNKEYRLIAKELNINYHKLTKVVNKTKNLTNIGQAMVLTWFSGDSEDENGIYLSKSKIKKINSNTDLDINDIVGLYKSGDRDLLVDILKYEKNYIMGIIKEQLIKYHYILPICQYRELYDYIEFELIKTVNNIVMRYPGQMIKYITTIIMYRTLDYLIENIFNKSYSYIDEISLEKNNYFITC